jgi:hypothetical protein
MKKGDVKGIVPEILMGSFSGSGDFSVSKTTVLVGGRGVSSSVGLGMGSEGMIPQKEKKKGKTKIQRPSKRFNMKGLLNINNSVCRLQFFV